MALSFPGKEPGIPPIVLLVGCDADTRELYEAAFQLDGLWVAEACDVDEAFDYASELQPNAIVTDVALGGDGGNLDGLALAERLLAAPRTTEIPIIAVTVLDPDSFGPRRVLFADVLQKPVPVERLVERVKGAITRSAELRARGDRARNRAPELLQRSERLLGRAHLKVVSRDPETRVRPCPKCGEPLRWSERRMLDGVLFDYYYPCTRGCGLFCFDHGVAQFVTIIG